MANFTRRWVATIIMQHCALLHLNKSCLYHFMFLMGAFMEELNCGHLVWYVYDEFTSLSTLFIAYSWSGFWDLFRRFCDGWSMGYIGTEYKAIGAIFSDLSV
jgi:hypothetical protein